MSKVSAGDPVVVTYYYSVTVNHETSREASGTAMMVHNGIVVVSMDEDSTIQFFPEDNVRLKD